MRCAEEEEESKDRVEHGQVHRHTRALRAGALRAVPAGMGGLSARQAVSSHIGSGRHAGVLRDARRRKGSHPPALQRRERLPVAVQRGGAAPGRDASRPIHPLLQHRPAKLRQQHDVQLRGRPEVLPRQGLQGARRDVLQPALPRPARAGAVQGCRGRRLPGHVPHVSVHRQQLRPGGPAGASRAGDLPAALPQAAVLRPLAGVLVRDRQVQRPAGALLVSRGARWRRAASPS